MVKLLLSLLALNLIFFQDNLVYAQKIGFQDLLLSNPTDAQAFCIPNSAENKIFLENNSIALKYESTNWLHFQASPTFINDNYKSGKLNSFHFEFSLPQVLADTVRLHHYVDPVHQGLAPLVKAYTGKGVVVGIIDQGLELTHPDFLDDQGRTRVLRYWDHSMVSGPNSPAPYGYGQLWDSTAINNGSCTSGEESSAHGSSVSGVAVGDGSANGSNKGMAPDANIVFVETNFNLSNWTLTIADAVDYIVKFADSLGMPAVINISLGSYLGSHDGNDPAAEYIETLLDEKAGRIVVAAAGNGGNQGPFHQQSTVTVDTNFVWFLNNPTNVLGANKIYFDVWSDQSDATYSFALGADTPGPAYSFRGRTSFHLATDNMPAVIYDTIWNNGNRIATIEAYREYEGSNYHLELVVKVDSTNYLYRFETTGSGKYDLWSGLFLGLNNMVTAIPTPGEMPDIIKYVLPDQKQTIVSSWNCSEKVVSVGNFKNRLGHIDNNNVPYVSTGANVGELSYNSSKGPNRHGLIKPDVAAAGDVSLGAGPFWVLNNPAYNSVIDSGGMHVRNGGTSMASPAVAGIAALYLEACTYRNYQDFKTDLIATAYSDSYTGVVPNNSYGAGKPNAFELLQLHPIPAQPVISFGPGYILESTPENAYQWVLNGSQLPGETAQNHTPVSPYGNYQVTVINSSGCTATSEVITISLGSDELDQQFSLFPNPTTGVVTITGEKKIDELRLYDQFGKACLITETGSNQYSLEGLSTGIYHLELVFDGKPYHLKIIRK